MTSVYHSKSNVSLADLYMKTMHLKSTTKLIHSKEVLLKISKKKKQQPGKRGRETPCFLRFEHIVLKGSFQMI